MAYELRQKAERSLTKLFVYGCAWKEGRPQNDHINMENKDWHALKV